MRQFAVIAETSCLKIDGSVFRHISVSVFQKRFYHLLHPVDFLGCLRMNRRRFYIQGFHILFTLFNITLGNNGRLHTLFLRFFDDFIIHIREIGHIIDLPALVFHISSDRIEYNHRSCISDMNQVIDRRSAYIYADLTLFMGHELLFFLR